MVNYSKMLSVQEGSLREMASEVKSANDFAYNFFLVNCTACFIYSECISKAVENKLIDRPVNARSAKELTFESCIFDGTQGIALDLKLGTSEKAALDSTGSRYLEEVDCSASIPRAICSGLQWAGTHKTRSSSTTGQIQTATITSTRLRPSPLGKSEKDQQDSVLELHLIPKYSSEKHSTEGKDGEEGNVYV
ncbi:hypothetical protein BTVI_07935 [Pitangus sulphuratus]|nr:hypothetical protein BTVI_07935 [Pitangus sulphuratus]